MRLFENNSLVVPSFGALTLKYSPSTIDHVQGLLNPPTKSINFDGNLVVNDGKLVDIIQKKHQVSSEEANRQIARFVNIMKDQLNRREMVNIAGVGRLYKDFENKIQFNAKLALEKGLYYLIIQPENSREILHISRFEVR